MVLLFASVGAVLEGCEEGGRGACNTLQPYLTVSTKTPPPAQVSPLHLAARFGLWEVSLLLLNRGAAVNGERRSAAGGALGVRNACHLLTRSMQSPGARTHACTHIYIHTHAHIHIHTYIHDPGGWACALARRTPAEESLSYAR